MAKHPFKCPQCDQSFTVTAESNGKRSRCTRCQTVFVITLPTKTPVPDKQAGTPPSVRSPASSDSTVSPYEALASQVMGHKKSSSAVTPPSVPSDYLSTNRSLGEIGNHSEVDQHAMRVATLGGGLVLFGLILFTLAFFLGFNTGRLFSPRPVGMLISIVAEFVGCCMLMVGFRRRILLALLFGGMPLVMLVLAIGSNIFLFDGDVGGLLSTTRSPVANVSRHSSSRTNVTPIRRNPTRDRNVGPVDDIFLTQRPKSKIAQLKSPGLSDHQFGSKANDDNPFSESGEDLNPFKVVSPSGTSPDLIAFPTFNPQISIDSELKQDKMSLQMQRAFGLSSYDQFPDDYMTESAGTATGASARFFAHHQKRPMIGIEVSPSIDGQSLQGLLPVYSTQDTAITIAKRGYAIGGLEVNVSGNEIIGIRCVFMKAGRQGLDRQDSYLGPWVGTRPRFGRGTSVHGDGHWVYGLWYESAPRVSALGLIRDP